MYTFLQRTRAFTWLMALLVLAATTAQAQVGNYVPTRVARTFVQLTGDSVAPIAGSGTADDGTTNPIAIPAFTFGGSTFTRISMSTNGLAQFSNSNTLNTTLAGSSYNLSNSINCIAPLAMDQTNSTVPGATQQMSVKKFGSDSVILQWKDFGRYVSGGNPLDRWSYQAILIYPSTIKYTYSIDPTVMGTSTTGPNIGMSASTSSGNQVVLGAATGNTAQESWEAPLLGPNNSLTTTMYLQRGSNPSFYYPTATNNSYTFTYNTGGCQRPGNITTGTTTSTSQIWTWTNVGAAGSGYNYEVRTSGLPGSGPTGRIANGTLASGTATYTQTGLLPGTRYVFYLQSNCGSGLSGWVASSPSTTTALATTDPTVFLLDAVGSTSARFRWVAASGTPAPTGYDYVVVTRGAGPFNNVVASGNTASTSVTVSGLTAGTHYYFYVRTAVAGGQSKAYVGPVAFATQPSAVAIPPTYSNDFNTLNTTNASITFFGANNFPVTATGAPTGFSGVISNAGGSTSPTIGNNASNGVGSTGAISIAPGTTTGAFQAWVFTPQVSLTSGQTISLSFDGIASTTTGTPAAQVYIGSAADPSVMTTTIGSSITLTSTFTTYSSGNYTVPSTGTYVLGVRYSTTAAVASPTYRLDNLSIINQLCGGPPSGLALTALTSATANITWASNPGATSGFEYSLSTDGGTTWGTTQTLAAGSTSVGLSGLLTSQAYVMRIRSVCSGGAQQSVYSTISFTTSCATTSLPYLQSVTSSSTLPSCVTGEPTLTSGTNLSTVGAVTPGAGSLRAPSAATTVFWFGPFNVTSGSQYQTSFFVTGASATTTSVVDMAYNTAPLIASATVTNVIPSGSSITTTPTRWSGVFTAPATGTYFVGIRAVATVVLYFDEIGVDLLPCGLTGLSPTPTMGTITGSSAVVNWSNMTGATNGYEYQLSTDNGTSWSASTPLSAGSTTVTVSGLNGCANYLFRIRSLCPAGSSPYNQIAFATTGPASLPYSQNFDVMPTLGTGVLPPCWTNIVVAGTGLATTTTSGFAYSGTNRIFSTWSSNGAAVLPGLALTGGVTYQFSFQGRNQDANIGNFVMMKVNTSAVLAGSSRLATFTNTTTPNTITPSFQKFKVQFTPASSGTYYFIAQDSVPTSTPNGFSMDDFKVQVTPTCIEPATVAAASSFTTTAVASWSAASPVPSLGYYYKIVSGSGSYSSAAYLSQQGMTTSLNQTFSGLVEGSTYTVWVRSVCSTVDSSDWAAASFTHIAPLAMTVVKDNSTFNSILTDGISSALAWNSTTTTDDNYSTPTNIGFNFTYCGRPMTRFSVMSNGRVRLISANGTATGSTSYQNVLATADTNMLMPMFDDLVVGRNEATAASLAANVRYELTTGSPRKLIIEYKGAKYLSSTPFGVIQYQVILEETTNKITFHYGQVQGYDFVTAANLLVTPTIGLTGKTLSSPPVKGQALIKQFDDGAVFSHHGFSTTQNAGSNHRSALPICDDRYVFTPNPTAAYVVADTTAPAYDDPTSAATILALPAEPSNLCGLQFTTKYATKTSTGIYPNLLADNTTNGFADDDVWISFQALSPNSTIKVVGSGGMRPAFQVYDATITPIAGAIKVGTTSDYGKPIALNVGGLNPGDYYYVRVYHYHGGTQAKATATVAGGVITAVTSSSAGTDYNFGTLTYDLLSPNNTGTGWPDVRIYDATGQGAVVDATVSAGGVTSYSVIDGGTGYTSPTIRVNRPGFSPTGAFGLYVFSTPAPPANDLVKNATTLPVTAGTSCTSPVTNQLTFAATGTSRAVGTDCPSTTADDDVWYKFTATRPTFSLSVTPGTTTDAMDVAVQIFNAGPTNDTTTMTSVICANSFGSGAAEIIGGSVDIGSTYYIRVYSPNLGDGGILGRFSICAYAPPALKFDFAQNRGTYTPITGGTALTFPNQPTSLDDDTLQVNLSPGFTFNGTTYSKIWVNLNGYISFGSAAGQSGTARTPLSSFIGDGAISALGVDLIKSAATGASPEVRVQYVGNEHIIQWKDFAFYTADATQQIGFQIRLNTSTGVIQFVYDSVNIGTNYKLPQVGIRTGSPTIPYMTNNRATSNTWLNTTTAATTSGSMVTGAGAGLFPGKGLTYTFTPNNIEGYPWFGGLLPKSITTTTPASAAIAYPTTNSARVRWMPKAEAINGYYIRWRKLSDPITAATYATPTAWGTTANDTSYTITGLKSNTAYIFDVAARNGADVSAYGVGASFTTLPIPDDAGAAAYVSPTSLCVGSSIALVGSFKNLGTNTIATGTTVGMGFRITSPSAVTTTLTGSLVTTAPMATNATVNVSSSNYTFSSIGTYTVQIWSVYTADGDASNDTLTTLGTVTVSASTSVAGGYLEGLNGPSFPAGYSTAASNTTYPLTFNTTADFAGEFGFPPATNLAPEEGSGVVRFNAYSAGIADNASFTTGCFDITNSCSFLRFSLAQYDSWSTELDGVEAYVSANNGPFVPVQLSDSINRTIVTRALRYDAAASTARWNRYKADLSSYNGQTIRVRLVFIADGGDRVFMDNLRIVQRPNNDVGVQAFQSPEPSPSCASKSTPVTVTIKNYGCSDQTNIPVNLTVTGPAGAIGLGSFSFTVPGPVISGGSYTTTVKLQDLTVAGTYTFTAGTGLVGDGDVTNDVFGPYTVVVNSSNLPPVAAGTATPSSILINTSSNLAGTAPGAGPVTFTNNTNYPISTAANNKFQAPITVVGAGTVAANLTSVQFNITHTYDSDVRVRLIAPNGSVLRLYTRHNSGGTNFVNTTFTGTATTSITAGSAPYSGVFTPTDNWATWAAGAGNIAGTWNLEVVDSISGDGGALTNWNLTFNNGTVTNTWTAFVGNPASIAGFPYSGTSPGNKTFTTAGTYNFLYQSTFQNGCSSKDTVTVLVSDGNVWTGAVSSAWGNAGNWQFGAFANGSAATIPAGTPNSPLITSAVSTTNITLGAGQTITLGAGGSLNVAGNVTGNLSNIGGNRAVTFSGTGVQTINGIVTLDSVTVTNTNPTGLTFAAGAQLRIAPGGNLRLGNNARITVPANGALVLKSSAAGTARLLPVPASAQITGNITMERRTPTLAGWYFVGAPVKTGDLTQWAEMGVRVSPKNNANIFEYTEPDTTRGRYNGYLTEVNGWKVPSALTNPINPTTPSLRPKGYRMYLNSTFFTQQNATLSVTGQPIVGNVAFPFTKSAAGFQGGGWNLASNPYPCEIDWQAVKTDAVAGNASAPLSDFIQIWNSAAGAYSNYSIAIGVGTLGGSRYIPSSQAFFIRATAGGNLNFREAHKTQQTNTFLRDVFPANTLRLTLSDGTHIDQSVVGFRVFGSNGRDQYDADKLNGNYLNVSTMPEPTLNLVANVMGELVAQTEIPVRIGTTSTGTQSMTLSFEGIESFDAGSTLYLRDNYLNTLTDLNQTQLYSFQITNDPATYGDSRFVLVTAPQSVTVVKTKVQPAISVWPNPAEGASKLNVRLSNLGNGNAVVTMTDALGREVARTSAALSEGTLETSFKIEALPAGVYMLRARSGSATIVKEVVIR